MVQLRGWAIFLVLALAGSGGAWAQNDTVRMFYMGNSFLYFTQTPDRPELPEKLALLASANGHTIQWQAQISGGKDFAWHWAAGGAQRMRDHRFDVVVAQDQSQGPIIAPHAFLDYAERFGAVAAEQGQRLLFFMTMGYRDQPQMIDTISVMYRRAARLASGGTIPCGLAWKIAYARYPELQLHHPDGQHPALAGVYVNVLMCYRVVFGQQPKHRVEFDLGGLDDVWYERLEQCVEQAYLSCQSIN